MTETIIVIDHETDEVFISTESRGIRSRLEKYKLQLLAYKGVNGKERRWTTRIPANRLSFRVKK